MTSKSPAGSDTIPVHRRQGETEAAAVARARMRPSINAARTAQLVLNDDAGEAALALIDLVDELAQQCQTVIGGDLRRPAALLLMQAQTLDLMFHDLVRQGYGHLPAHADVGERLIRLGLRAQAQSRATLEVLAALKNPSPTVIAVTTGLQQVNNGVACAHPKEIESGRNELLENSHDEWLEPRTTSSAGTENSVLATVGILNGAAIEKG